MLEAFPKEVRGTAANFYKFWTDRWVLHALSCDVVDLSRVRVSQSARTFGLALECRKVLTDFQGRTMSSEKKLASAEEELKRLRADVEETKA